MPLRTWRTEHLCEDLLTIIVFDPDVSNNRCAGILGLYVGILASPAPVCFLSQPWPNLPGPTYAGGGGLRVYQLSPPSYFRLISFIRIVPPPNFGIFFAIFAVRIMLSSQIGGGGCLPADVIAPTTCDCTDGVPLAGIFPPIPAVRTSPPPGPHWWAVTVRPLTVFPLRRPPRRSRSLGSRPSTPAP